MAKLADWQQQHFVCSIVSGIVTELDFFLVFKCNGNQPRQSCQQYPIFLLVFKQKPNSSSGTLSTRQQKSSRGELRRFFLTNQLFLKQVDNISEYGTL